MTSVDAVTDRSMGSGPRPAGSEPSPGTTHALSRIPTQTTFNGISLLSGGAAITFQVGAEDGQTLTVNARNLFGTGGTGDIDSSIFTFSGTVALASSDARTARSTFGSIRSRLEHTLNNLVSYEENPSASERRIRDVEMAAEMVKFTKHQILQQAGTSVLAQSNSAPQSVLSLLR